jgi:hypothetical protein
MQPIAQFSASVANVKTMADGSPRFTFDAPESEVELLSVLARARLDGTVMTVVIYDADEFVNEMQKERSKIKR